MNKAPSYCAWILLFLLIFHSGLRAFGQPNGIYADFTTSMGSFTCKLEYAIAPKAVANFVGLANGQRAWLDLNNGRARTNLFFNGLIFHRVISNFVIQAGSPNGVGTDGPGYVFRDEISPALRFTNSFMLAMANSGTNSNGSQFFLTVSPQPSLNNGYTIFGQLVGGTNIVQAINLVPVDGADKPLTNITIQNIGIRRIGTAAQAFDIHAQELPIVRNLGLSIAKSGGQASLTYSNRLFTDNRLFSSTNLATWLGENLGIETAMPVTNKIYRPTSGGPAFYLAAQVQYPATTLAPKSVYSRVLTLNFSGGPTIVITFNSSGGGTYTISGGSPGTLLGYDWIQEPYRARLWPIEYSGLVPMTLLLNFATAASGSFSGTVYTSPLTTPVGGSWVLN